MTQRIKKSWLLVLSLTVSIATQAQPVTTTEASSKPAFYTYLALILALLALIGLILLWLRNQAGWEKINADRRSAVGNSDGMRELSGRVSALEQANKSFVKTIRDLENQVAKLREQQADNRKFAPAYVAQPAPEPQLPPVEQRPAARVPEPVVQKSVASQAAQSQRSMPVNTPPAKLYARTVDVPGGFSVSSLVETPNRPMVFVITPTGAGQATFRVTDDLEAQRLALSDPYSYLSDACNYQSRPEVNSRIHMISDGKLQLQGEKWHIIEKAEISFYA